MAQILDDFIQKKTDDILSSPGYQDLTEDEREKLGEKIEDHLEFLILETFVNRITEEEAKRIISLLEDDKERAYKEIRKVSVKNEALIEDLESRINREVEMFKSL